MRQVHVIKKANKTNIRGNVNFVAGIEHLGKKIIQRGNLPTDSD